MDKPKIAGTTPIRVELEAGQRCSWCTCGLSENQPFCNGSHKGTDFRPLPYVAEEAKTVSFCTCKMTGNPPFCDGSHRKIASSEDLT